MLYNACYVVECYVGADLLAIIMLTLASVWTMRRAESSLEQEG